MTNLTPTNLLAGLSRLREVMAGAEFRPPDSAALAVASLAEQTDPGLAEVREREDRTVNYDALVRMDVGSGTARAAAHTGDRPDSARTAFYWQTYVETWSISEKQCDNNTFGFPEVLAKQILSKTYALIKRFDDWFIAQLKADVTQINVGGIRGTWNQNSDYVMAVNAAQQDYQKEQISTCLGNNEYNMPLTIIGDSLCYMDMTKSMNQGPGNSSNLQYQFDGGNMITKTTKTLYSDYNGSAIAFPTGMVAVVPWIPKQNRKPLDMEMAVNGNVGAFGQMSMPIRNKDGNVIYELPIAVSMYSQRANTASSNGNVQDVLFEGELSLDMGYLSAYLSDFRATGDFAGLTDSVVYAFGLKNVEVIN